jgi:hypothetical protein
MNGLALDPRIQAYGKARFGATLVGHESGIPVFEQDGKRTIGGFESFWTRLDEPIRLKGKTFYTMPEGNADYAEMLVEKPYSAKTRQHINKAKRHGFTLKISDSPAGYFGLDDLERKHLGRSPKQRPSVSPNDFIPHQYYEVWDGDTLTTALTCYESSGVKHFAKIAVHPAYRDKHVGPLAYDFALQDAPKASLGLAIQGHGIFNFKTSLGGVPHYFYDSAPFPVRLLKRAYRKFV